MHRVGQNWHDLAAAAAAVRRLTGKLMEQNRHRIGRNLGYDKGIYNQKRKKLLKNVISEHLASHLEEVSGGRGMWYSNLSYIKKDVQLFEI